jgi:hypothetical protein
LHCNQGVGKGRQIAGLIMANIARGRRRHVWVSTSSDLCVDAKRDLLDLGCHVDVIAGPQELDRRTGVGGVARELDKGVMFVTYATLSRDPRRLAQVVRWCQSGARAGTAGRGAASTTFDGLVVFDESHKAKNADQSTGSKV